MRCLFRLRGSLGEEVRERPESRRVFLSRLNCDPPAMLGCRIKVSRLERSDANLNLIERRQLRKNILWPVPAPAVERGFLPI